ncbi:hypothetical protein J8L98_03930 [Pseudoalteromonas sp. MMG013]|uniref:lipopolysaccharide biosynthesis protein n=1 Tax=Pseudoalteromonas sp. MMG013 TaxID=2822687 RepID=UPI001B35EFB9|nr:hypothetical protein [Pseudoalteromonas sp. MMG013]MBQ4860845.1 hypothetical protein [Pseudoalteromonas sp. MMG013]
MFRKIKENKYLHSILMLVSGSAFGHILTFLALPLLTRYFSPSDFEVLAVFVAITTLVSSAACCRFEIAIPLPKHDKNALALLLISVMSASIVALLACVLIITLEPWLVQSFLLSNTVLYLIPAGIFCAALFNVLQFWATRQKAFRLVAKTRISQSVFGNSTQLISAYFSIPLGLIIGQLLNYSSGIFSIARFLVRDNWRCLRALSCKRLWFIAKKYDQYPKLSTLEVLANNGGIQLPIVLIAYFVVGPEAGYLFLALKLMQVPMALIGGSIAQVFYAEIAKSDAHQISEITEKNISSLMRLGVGPIIFLGGTLEIFAIHIFGDAWQRVGEIMVILLPWFVLQFLSSPISMIMHVAEAQRQMLYLTIFGFVIRIGGLCTVFWLGANSYVEVLGVTCGIYYGICLFVFARKAKVDHARLFTLLKLPAAIVTSSIVLVLILRGVFL